jgi:hypothetical protein
MNRLRNDDERPSDGSKNRDLRPAGAVDVHQHLWPDPFLEAMRRRQAPPRLRGWTLELLGEPEYVVDSTDHDPAARALEARGDGLALALVSLSSPLGIEYLAPDESDELLDAYHLGVLDLPAPFAGWAAAGLRQINPGALELWLGRGFVGLQLPATAVMDEPGYELVGPLLEVLEDADKPLFVHPGPPANGSVARDGVPGWWPAIVTYVQQMHAAWYAFRAHGRERHPRLRVCFALLAGLAPLHGERFVNRAGDRGAVDENAFVEISSYGTRAIDACVRVLGVDVLLNGSDRPYSPPVLPGLGAAAWSALRSANPIRFLGIEKEVPRGLAFASGAQS